MMHVTVLDTYKDEYVADKMYLDMAHRYAVLNTGCTKVAVGTIITTRGSEYERNIVSIGANVVIGDRCLMNGCQRVELYGNNHKEHRLPSDCRAVHSEITALLKLKHYGKSDHLTAYITRYPCEACARALVIAGVTRIVWGRQQYISEQTEEILYYGGISAVWCNFWKAEDNLL